MRHLMVVAAACVMPSLISSKGAAAEPLAVNLGLGMRADLGAPPVEADSSERSGMQAELAVAAPLRPGVALGVHAGISTPRTFASSLLGSHTNEDSRLTRMPLELGVTAIVARGRWWIAPWLGAQAIRSSHGEEVTRWTYSPPDVTWTRMELGPAWTWSPAAGLAAGVDLVRWRELRAGLVVDGHASRDGSAIGAGLALRR